jgi:hypothetical protein
VAAAAKAAEVEMEVNIWGTLKKVSGEMSISRGKVESVWAGFSIMFCSESIQYID